MTNEYRIGVTIRRQGEPMFTSVELRTENCGTLDDLTMQAAEFIVGTINEDQEAQDDSEN